MSPDATYPTTEAIATTTEFVLSCGESFSPAMVKKCASSIEPVCKWVLAMVNQQPSAAAGGAGGEGAGFASVPMPVQVASVPPSVAPSSAAAAPSAADAAAAAAGAAAGGGGRGGDEMEALIGATLQRMAEQLDVLTVRNAQRTTTAALSTEHHASTEPRHPQASNADCAVRVALVRSGFIVVAWRSLSPPPRRRLDRLLSSSDSLADGGRPGWEALLGRGRGVTGVSINSGVRLPQRRH
jgi:hypothetical protein